jgi:hypothetical protein
MSLVVDLAVLAEGAATDSRGNITLVGVNPNLFMVETFPVQFNPVFLVALGDEKSGTFVPGRAIAATVQAVGPDDEVLYVAPAYRQTITPPLFPALPIRANIVGQVPFTASKPGTYTVSVRMAVLDSTGTKVDEATAVRTVMVSDLATLKTTKAD